ncbi:MAG: HAD-IIA family hydrolase [Limisphaerales bacterium]
MNFKQQTQSKISDALRRIRHVALDMDGTIYLNKTVFDTTVPFLALLDRLGIGHTFLTNNPSRSTAEYLAHLSGMGIPAAANALYTSTQATIDFLKSNFPDVRGLFVLGTRGLCDELRNAGFELTPDSPDAPPDAVLVGFDKTLTYNRLCRAAWWIKQGKPFFATNPDLVCPTDEPTVLIDCGSITAALEKATGEAPRAVLGKPDPAMLRGIMRRHSLAPENLAMVGDRLYTDMEMARRAGVLGVLVLTGEATAADAQGVAKKPSLIVPTLHEFGEMLQSASASE